MTYILAMTHFAKNGRRHIQNRYNSIEEARKEFESLKHLHGCYKFEILTGRWQLVETLSNPVPKRRK